MIKISRMPMPIAASSRDSAQTVPGPLVRRKNLSNVRSGIRVQWALSFIDTDEFHVLLVRLDGDVSREECELDFEAADTAGDGYIEFKEFMAGGRIGRLSSGTRGCSAIRACPPSRR
jgi:hypothetical protein